MKQTNVYILIALIQDDKIFRGDHDKTTRVRQCIFIRKRIWPTRILMWLFWNFLAAVYRWPCLIVKPQDKLRLSGPLNTLGKFEKRHWYDDFMSGCLNIFLKHIIFALSLPHGCIWLSNKNTPLFDWGNHFFSNSMYSTKIQNIHFQFCSF